MVSGAEWIEAFLDLPALADHLEQERRFGAEADQEIELVMSRLAGVGVKTLFKSPGFDLSRAGKVRPDKVVETKGEGSPWSGEVKYPSRMTLELRAGRLAGCYSDQWGFSDDFELVAVINQGHDHLLVHGGAGTKNPQALSPIHHAKLTDGKLHAVVTSHDKLFEWVAERR